MTCTIPRPTPKNLFERIKNQFSANVLKGGKVIPESNEWWVVQNDYLAAETFYSIAEQQWKERDARDACCDNLVKMAADRGVYPYPASFARGYVTVTGTPGAALSPNMQFRFGTNYYRANPAMTLPTEIAANGSATVPIIADEPGSSGNDLGTTGTTGQLLTNLINVDSTATACGTSFCNGRDAETCEEFRTRFLDRSAHRPLARLDWVTELMRDFPCFTRACLRNCDCCDPMPDLQLFVFFDGTFPNGIPPASVVQDMQTWFFGSPQGIGAGKAPIGVRGSLHAAVPATLNVSITGLECSRSDQLQTIKERIAALFAGLCPGTTLCQRQFDVVVAQVVGTACNYNLFLEIPDGVTGLTLSDCGDIVAECDVLPVLGTIDIPTGAC